MMAQVEARREQVRAYAMARGLEGLRMPIKLERSGGMIKLSGIMAP